jgi:hypothetical protein
MTTGRNLRQQRRQLVGPCADSRDPASVNLQVHDAASAVLAPAHHAADLSHDSRAAVEREFGRLKHEWALLPLRVRGLDRVRLHADLTILAKLSCALARARAVPLAA